MTDRGSNAGSGHDRRTLLRATLTGALGLSGAGGSAATPRRAANPLDFDIVSMPRQAPAREAMIDVGGARLWAWDTGGTGPAVVLLHPLSGSAAGWVYQQPALARAGYRVIAYSRRGHFNSEAGPASSPGNASDDLARLLELLGVHRFHAIGMAAGGLCATDFALSYPKRLRSITLGGSLIAVDDAAYMKASASLRPKGFFDMPPEFRELGPCYRAADPEGVAAWRQLESQAVHARVDQGTLNSLTLGALAALSMPVLLLTGDADLFTPPPMLRRIAAQVKNREIAVIDDAGHASHWEQPVAFNRIVLDFLGRH